MILTQINSWTLKVSGLWTPQFCPRVASKDVRRRRVKGCRARSGGFHGTVIDFNANFSHTYSFVYFEVPSSQVTLDYRRCIRTHVYRVWYVWFTIERSNVDSFRIRKDGKFVESFIEIFDNILSKFYCSILRPSVGFFVSVGWWSDLPITSFDLFGYEIEEEEAILRKPKLPLVYSINREMLT